MNKTIFKLKNKINNNSGYTLVEIMMTIALLSLLFSLVNTSVMTMERRVVADQVDTNANNLYFNAQDLIVKERGDGNYDDNIALSAGLWRGFNPLDPATQARLGSVSGFDVAYMVEYPDYVAETGDPIDYSSFGIDVEEGYQLDFLKDLIEPEEGSIQAYGILFELQTGTILETNVVKIPYSSSGDVTYNARQAAKIASTIVGTGVRDMYQAHYSSETTILPLFLGSASDATIPVNGYGESHLFNRANMFSSIDATMYQARLDYCERVVDYIQTSTGYTRLPDYLDDQISGLKLNDVLSFTGLAI